MSLITEFLKEKDTEFFELLNRQVVAITMEELKELCQRVAKEQRKICADIDLVNLSSGVSYFNLLNAIEPTL